MGSLSMTRAEREAFLADLHVGVISIAREGRGPLAIPIWYAYAPGGEIRIVTGGDSFKLSLLRRAGRFTLCAQDETPPYRYVSVEGPVVSIDGVQLQELDYVDVGELITPPGVVPVVIKSLLFS